MISLSELIIAGAPATSEIVGYWKVRLRAPAIVSGSIRECTLLRIDGDNPQLWITEKGVSKLDSSGLAAIHSFMKTVEHATLAEVA